MLLPTYRIPRPTFRVLVGCVINVADVAHELRITVRLVGADDFGVKSLIFITETVNV